MKNLKKHELMAIILIISGFIFASCSGGSPAGIGGGASINGLVADGYVSNAEVYVYSDVDMTNQIGSGLTDSNGNFSITLSVSSVPNPVYLKSVGGIDVATGMPAPTMLFVANEPSAAHNITPLTDSLYKYSLTLGIDEAKNYLSGRLEISNAELYDDPVANTDLNAALNSILSSGTMAGTLADGDYLFAILFFQQDSFNEAEINVTISNGELNGTADMGEDPYFVTGKIQGSSLVISMTDSNDPAQVSALVRIAGDIGLMGSVAGIYTGVWMGDTEIYSGMFVGSFVPASGTDPAGVASLVPQIYSGSRHIIIRDIFGETYKLGWGDLNINIDPDTGDVTADNTTLWFDWGTDPADEETFIHPNDDPVILEFVGGQILQSSEELLTSIIFLEFEVTAPFSATVQFFQPVGSRRAIFLIDGDVSMIGDAYMATGEGLAPSLEADANYDVKVATAHLGMIGQSRSDWIGSGADQMPYTDSFTTPLAFDSADPDFSGNLLKIYNGSILAFKNDDDDGSLNNGFDEPDLNGEPDFIRLVELYETGAIQGEQIIGGTVGEFELAIPLSSYPATFVGFVKKQGESAPSVSGTLNFLSRVLYSASVLFEGVGDGYLNAYITGTLSLSGSSATLNYRDPLGSTETASLTAENTEGLYHMHGPLDSSTYLDIFWPVGGKKAVYMTSNNDTGDWLITEVGEAYLTR